MTPLTNMQAPCFNCPCVRTRQAGAGPAPFPFFDSNGTIARKSLFGGCDFGFHALQGRAGACAYGKPDGKTIQAHISHKITPCSTQGTLGRLPGRSALHGDMAVPGPSFREAGRSRADQRKAFVGVCTVTTTKGEWR